MNGYEIHRTENHIVALKQVVVMRIDLRDLIFSQEDACTLEVGVIRNAYAHSMIGIAVEDGSDGFPLARVRLFGPLMVRMNANKNGANQSCLHWRLFASFVGDQFPTQKNDSEMNDLIYVDECYKIIGGCFEVYNDKGCGFLESVYQECLEIEYEYQQVPFVPQEALRLFYRGKELKQRFIPDFICFGKIIVEIKAVDALTDKHRAQVINYLNATGYQLGLLVNFGDHPKIEWERLVLTNKKAR